ncbi:hypothetical protein EV426DRAFT_709187 [Tirmania nivea]|nr:hypothetical protein EV426DRAFT_709187 [Tirmania nivea]
MLVAAAETLNSWPKTKTEDIDRQRALLDAHVAEDEDWEQKAMLVSTAGDTRHYEGDIG